MTLLALICMAVLAYGVTGVHAARSFFARWRPFTEPLACEHRPHHEGRYPFMRDEASGHSRSCYQRPGTLIDSMSEAAGFAFLYGLAWPLTMLVTVGKAQMLRLARSWTRETAAERDAKIARLERELRSDAVE